MKLCLPLFLMTLQRIGGNYIILYHLFDSEEMLFGNQEPKKEQQKSSGLFGSSNSTNNASTSPPILKSQPLFGFGSQPQTTQPTPTFGSNIFPNNSNQVNLIPPFSPKEPSIKDLLDRLNKSDELIKGMKQEQDKLRKEFEDYRKENPTMKEVDKLKKQLAELQSQVKENSNSSGNTGSMPRGNTASLFANMNLSSQPLNISPLPTTANNPFPNPNNNQRPQSSAMNPQLKESINTLNKLCAKKQSELECAIALINKQQKTIQAQSIKISGLETQIENGFAKLSLQLSNMGLKNDQIPAIRTPFDIMMQHPQPQMPSYPQFQQQQQLQQMAMQMPSQPKVNNFFENHQNPYLQQNLFSKRQNNPLSQSAVFESRPMETQDLNNNNNNNNNTTYKEDGYLIKYRNTNNHMIQNLQISNFLGKIEVLEPIDKKYLTSKKISHIVNIGANVCEILDHEWDNFAIKLTTFNFMNMQQMSFTERVELNKKVKRQAESTGLDYYLDARTGDLEITMKPRQNR